MIKHPYVRTQSTRGRAQSGLARLILVLWLLAPLWALTACDTAPTEPAQPTDTAGQTPAVPPRMTPAATPEPREPLAPETVVASSQFGELTVGDIAEYAKKRRLKVQTPVVAMT